MTEEGLALISGDIRLTGDFSRLKKRIRPQNLRSELVVRAARMKDVPEPTAADMTAGLGEDAFLLAAAGFRVTLFERDPVIAALLQDALDRALADPDLSGIAERMHLIPENSIPAVAALRPVPDVICLDPMFPERTKSSLVKKKFQLLHLLEGPASDEEALLRAAMDAGPKKIIIKRPLKGANLCGIRPGYSLCGKTVRWDCFVPPKPDNGGKG